ncbi:NTPase [Echinicola jeungdonensis]|uniref:NTPase n=1 Tax=Echinicola jeungdonensis TaxID=709343 RepID=A0ABV5J6T0_9BACT|nr:NTPase [Echinicola jeungdonensis]MDN3669212.1 NTPase [Echinicola jeungdonensis]
MKYIAVLFLWLSTIFQTFCQNTVPPFFLDGKAVVLISAAPDARPVIDWKSIAQEIHPDLVEAGGDPVAYYELEEITLSEEIQGQYAQQFKQRQISNIVVLTRKSSGQVFLNIIPFNGKSDIISAGENWSVQAEGLKELSEKLIAKEASQKSQNLMPLEVPTFLPPLVGGASGGGDVSGNFLARNPLNLNMFKLGVPLSGTSGQTALLTSYRYDLIGRSKAAIQAEQQAEKAGLERIMEEHYPHEVVYLSTIKSKEELLDERIQFVLMRVEGREGDLMESMGVNSASSIDKDRIVVKYYIKFLVRDELYRGPVWDAHPYGQKALIQFLENLKVGG